MGFKKIRLPRMTLGILLRRVSKCCLMSLFLRGILRTTLNVSLFFLLIYGASPPKKNKTQDEHLYHKNRHSQGWHNSFALGSSFWIPSLGGCVTGRLLWSQRHTQRQRSHCGAFGRSSGTSPSLEEVVPWFLRGGLRTWVWFYSIIIAVRIWPCSFLDMLFPMWRGFTVWVCFWDDYSHPEKRISGKEVDRYSQVQIVTSGKFACNRLKACSGYPI